VNCDCENPDEQYGETDHATTSTEDGVRIKPSGQEIDFMMCVMSTSMCHIQKKFKRDAGCPAGKSTANERIHFFGSKAGIAHLYLHLHANWTLIVISICD